MIRKITERIGDWLEDKLRSVFRPLSPDARVIVIVTMLALFSVLSIYMTVSGIYNFGKDRGRRLEIERIESVRLQYQPRTDTEPERDTINNLNEFEYGTADE